MHRAPRAFCFVVGMRREETRRTVQEAERQRAKELEERARQEKVSVCCGLASQKEAAFLVGLAVWDCTIPCLLWRVCRVFVML